MVPDVEGVWEQLTVNVRVIFPLSPLSQFIDLPDHQKKVNRMCSNLTNQVRSIYEVTKAVARGNLSHTVDVDVQGEMPDLRNTVNTMVGQLNSLANEVICMSIRVGTEGKLGGQAVVADVEEMWQVRLLFLDLSS